MNNVPTDSSALLGRKAVYLYIRTCRKKVCLRHIFVQNDKNLSSKNLPNN